MSRPRQLKPVLALLIVIAVGVGQLARPSGVAAADGQTMTASTTYTLNPAAGRVDVSVDVIVKNTTASTTTYVSCTDWYYDYYFGWYPITTTCPQTTSYYIKDTYLWLEGAFVFGTLVLIALFFSKSARPLLAKVRPLLIQLRVERPLVQRF